MSAAAAAAPAARVDVALERVEEAPGAPGPPAADTAALCSAAPATSFSRAVTRRSPPAVEKDSGVASAGQLANTATCATRWEGGEGGGEGGGGGARNASQEQVSP